jgi:predicted TIM-barrel fold metal-dependent hydrolase
VTSFIDAHVHPPVAEFVHGTLSPYLADLERHLGEKIEPQTPEQIADFFRSRDAKAVLLGWSGSNGIKTRPLGNADVAAIVASAPDVFWGFGSVDPREGALAVAGIHQAARLGLAGLAFHPAAQQLAPSHHDLRPIWETAYEHGLPCLIHTGVTRLGGGTPGGSGIGLDVASPMHVDSVAAAYPELKILLAHTGPLWAEEAVAIAVHKTNVHLCLAGMSPKVFSPELLDLIRGPLQHRAHFGSDYPFGSPDSWLAEWESLGMADEVSRAVLVDNTLALLTR